MIFKSSLDKAADKGERLVQKIVSTLGKPYNGNCIVVHIATGDYEIAYDGWEAFDILRNRHPVGNIYKAYL